MSREYAGFKRGIAASGGHSIDNWTACLAVGMAAGYSCHSWGLKLFNNFIDISNLFFGFFREEFLFWPAEIIQAADDFQRGRIINPLKHLNGFSIGGYIMAG